MFEWIVKYRNKYRNQYRVGNKRAVFLLWLEVSFGLLLVVFLLVLVMIFLG